MGEFNYTDYTGEPDDTDEEDQGASADPNSLAAKIKQSVAAAPDQPFDEASMQSHIDDLAKLAAKSDNASTGSKRSLAEAMDKADQLYRDNTDRNQWLEVAQLIGQAGARFGAAREGMRNGRDMTLGAMPTVDYNKRNEQEAADYKTRLGGLNELQRAGDEENKDQFNREALPHEQGIKVGLAKLQEGSASNRNATNERGQNIRAATQASAQANAEKLGSERLDQAQRMEQAKETHQDLQKTIEEKNKALAGIGVLADEVEGDMGEKELAQLKNKHAGELGLLDPADIKAAKDASTTDHWYGNSVDKDKFQATLNAKASSKYDERIQNLKSSLDALRSGRQATQGLARSAGPDPVVNVQGPSGQTVQMKKSVFDTKYANQQGYSIIK